MALAVCITLAWGALVASAPARSHRPQRQREVTTSLTGPLTIAWSGDPAHGCAAAGLCGVTGTLQMSFGGEQEQSSGSGPMLVEEDVTAVARVLSTAPDGTVTTCADIVPAELDFTTSPVGRPLRAETGGLDGIHLAGAGRCAGPTAGDVARLSLPAHRDAHGYDLSGTASATAGPFTMTGISGVRINATTGTDGEGVPGGIDSGGDGPVKTHSVLVESAATTYRVIGVTSSLTTAFSSRAAPLCDGLGVCGAQGRIAQSFATRGTVTFSGEQIVTRAAGRHAALRDLRDGVLPLTDTFGTLTIRGTIRETSSQAGGLTCSDTTSVVLPREPEQRSPRGADHLSLPGGSVFEQALADPFRTRCPGPSATDVLGDGTLAIARASVRAKDLGKNHLTITFRPRRSFTGSAYAGRRSGAVTLALTLERTRGTTHRETVFPGETVIG
jgi:hypothetical protein